MKQKKYVEHLRRTLPEEEEVECPNCKQTFYDQFNLLSLATLNFCLLCANKKLDKETIQEKYHVE
tara:strand:- start:404 stop:598 length:195 start_codon:yes stop_codon:yes gene_type:complete